MAKNIGFYQNFNLTLDRLSSALRCVQSNPQVSHIELAECMSVNRPIGEGFSAWLTHTGLTTTQAGGKGEALTYRLTPFGQLTAQYDPFLNDLGTKWVIHYFLATEHAERSEAWLVFVNQFLTPGQRFSSDQFQEFFADVAGAEAKNRSALTKDPQSVLYTYTKTQSLGRLGLLKKEKQIYVSTLPFLPHTLVVGYILLNWWQRCYDQTDTLRFSQLCSEEGSLGRVCQVDAEQVKKFVLELSNLGYLNFAETQHEPVNRIFQQPPQALLERYYRQR